MPKLPLNKVKIKEACVQEIMSLVYIVTVIKSKKVTLEWIYAKKGNNAFILGNAGITQTGNCCNYLETEGKEQKLH